MMSREEWGDSFEWRKEPKAKEADENEFFNVPFMAVKEYH
jgi:hypothetical protein